tara:strand:+ start:682 stop:954 length:273 start_codon:yes stop_codon:yes gene_type:complete
LIDQNQTPEAYDHQVFRPMPVGRSKEKAPDALSTKGFSLVAGTGLEHKLRPAEGAQLKLVAGARNQLYLLFAVYGLLVPENHTKPALSAG